MRDDNLPEPPACPDWCQSDNPGWGTSAGGVAQVCRCDLSGGVDIDGDPVGVHVTRFAFIDAASVTVCDPEIEIRCLGRVDHANAVSLSAALAAAAQMARAAAGRDAAA